MKLLRGIPGIFLNRVPKRSAIKNIVFIVSCNWSNAEIINNWLKSNFPDSKINYVLRESYPDVYKDKDLVISSDAVSLISKIKMIVRLRRKKFDLIVSSLSVESGFTALKFLGLLINGKYQIIFDEKENPVWLLGKNFLIVPKYILMATGSILLKFFTFLVLLPVGMLYVIARTIYYVIKKRIYYSKK